MSYASIYADLSSQYGPAVDLDQGAKLLTYSGHRAARSAIQRGTFPVPIRRAGNKIIISISDVAAFLAGEAPAPAPQPLTTQYKPLGGTEKRRPGRPRKVAVAAGVVA